MLFYVSKNPKYNYKIIILKLSTLKFFTVFLNIYKIKLYIVIFHEDKITNGILITLLYFL